MWKKKMAAALSVAFLAGSLTFGSTASAYIIDVGMADLAAKEKAESDKDGKDLKAEQKEVKEKNQENKKNVSESEPLQDKKRDTSAGKTEPKAVDDAMKAMEEAAKASNTSLDNKKAEEPKTAVPEKKTEESIPVQQNRLEAQKPVTENKTTQAAKPVQQSKKDEPKSGESKSENKQKDAKKERFQEILRDESFIYYMDTQSARYVPIPNRQDRMIDVWVKLVPNSFTDTAAGQPGKYYLEHYYINPKESQIQFLCELEVTGRPSNAIKERPYNSQNWENLVPGSVEDDIYHAVVKKVKSSSGIGGSMSPSVSDILDTLNIGL